MGEGKRRDRHAGGLPEYTPVLRDGANWCRPCWENDGVWSPTNPEKPNSPYCKRHYSIARAENTRRWREARKREADDNAVAVSDRSHNELTSRFEEVCRSLEAWSESGRPTPVEEVRGLLGRIGR